MGKRVPVSQAAQLAGGGGEAAFFRPSPPPPAEPERTPAADPETPPAERKKAPAAPRAPRQPRPVRTSAPVSEEDLMACQVYLPEEVLTQAQRLLRPAATGARRTVTKTLLVAAYARAVHNLGLDIDTSGLDRGMDAEATRRVEEALRAHFENS